MRPLWSAVSSFDCRCGGRLPISSRKRAVVGHLELAGAVRPGVGEGPLDVAEELALEERLGQGPHVDRDHQLAAAGRAAVNLAREHLLARAVLARDEDIGVRCGHLLDQLADARHGRARTPEHRLFVGQLALDFLQLLHLALRAREVVGALQGGHQTLVVPRLDHEVDRSVTHGPHRKVDVGIGREEHHLDVGIVAVNLLQPIEALVAGVDAGREVHVEQDDVDRLAAQRRQQLIGRRKRHHAGEVVAHEQLDGCQNAAVVVDDKQRTLFLFGHIYECRWGAPAGMFAAMAAAPGRAIPVFGALKLRFSPRKTVHPVQNFYGSVKIFYRRCCECSVLYVVNQRIVCFGTGLASFGGKRTKV